MVQLKIIYKTEFKLIVTKIFIILLKYEKDYNLYTNLE